MQTADVEENYYDDLSGVLYEIEEDEIDEEEEEEEEQEDPRLKLTPTDIAKYQEMFQQFYLEEKKRKEEELKKDNKRVPPQSKSKRTKEIPKLPIKYVALTLRKLGKYRTKKDIKIMVNETDPNGVGVIEFPEYLLPIARTLDDEPITRNEIIDALKVISKNNDTIQMKDLLELVMTLGEPFDIEEAAYLVRALDPKNKGTFKWMKFVNYVLPVPKTSKGGKKQKKKKGGKGGKKTKKIAKRKK